MGLRRGKAFFIHAVGFFGPMYEGEFFATDRGILITVELTEFRIRETFIPWSNIKYTQEEQ